MGANTKPRLLGQCTVLFLPRYPLRRLANKRLLAECNTSVQLNSRFLVILSENRRTPLEVKRCRLHSEQVPDLLGLRSRHRRVSLGRRQPIYAWRRRSLRIPIPAGGLAAEIRQAGDRRLQGLPTFRVFCCPPSLRCQPLRASGTQESCRRSNFLSCKDFLTNA